MKNISRKIIIGMICFGILIAVSAYALLLPRLEFQVSRAFLDRDGLHVLIRFTNSGLVDLTVSGELALRINGRDVYLRHMTFELFLLRSSEVMEFDASPKIGNRSSGYYVNPPFNLEAFAFLTVNGMQRTLTTNYNVSW
jgi:hypothetical protein